MTDRTLKKKDKEGMKEYAQRIPRTACERVLTTCICPFDGKEFISEVARTQVAGGIVPRKYCNRHKHKRTRTKGW